MKTFEKYHQGFRSVLQIVLLLNSRYSIQSNIEDISDEFIVQFVEENCFENFEELFSEIDEDKTCKRERILALQIDCFCLLATNEVP